MTIKNMHASICKLALVLCLTLHSFHTPALAMKPVWDDNGWLLLDAERGSSRMYTAYWAVVGGVETWFRKYEDIIQQYVFHNTFQDYWDHLPTYGYTQVTARKLAELIWRDPDLGLGSFADDAISQLIDNIESALRSDWGIGTFYKTYAKPEHFLWDPYPDWKWRSIYMEQRYADNQRNLEEYPHERQVDLYANCWGTASYLTRSYEWAYDYWKAKKRGQELGVDEEHSSFPYIHLYGWVNPPEPGCVYCFDGQFSFDDDLSNGANSVYFLKGTGDSSSTPTGLLNSFDIIRIYTLDRSDFWRALSLASYEDPSLADRSFEESSLNWVDGQQLGINVHSAVYLTTSDDGKAWFYEKGNDGPAYGYAQYGVRAFGTDPNWPYEGYPRSYFQRDPLHKRNLADSYELDWAGVEDPYPW